MASEAAGWHGRRTAGWLVCHMTQWERHLLSEGVRGRKEGCGISVRPCNDDDDDLMGITRSVNRLTNEALSLMGLF